jgi:hypothetical protein
MKTAILGTLFGTIVGAIICYGGFFMYQRAEVDRQLNYQRAIYMRAKATKLQIRVDALQKDNDHLRIDFELLKKQAPTPTPAKPHINPC